MKFLKTPFFYPVVLYYKRIIKVNCLNRDALDERMHRIMEADDILDKHPGHPFIPLILVRTLFKGCQRTQMLKLTTSPGCNG